MAAARPDAAGEAGRRDSAADISVIIVNWQRAEATIDCARSLRRWSALRPRVIVVDNGSGSQTAGRLERELPEATILASSSNLGFGGANNLAFEHLDTEFVLLLNNDARLEEGAARRLLEALRAEPAALLAGPLLEAAEPPYPILAAGGRDIARHGRTHDTAEERRAELAAGRPFVVDYVPGTAALARVDGLRRLGGFDESYFFSGEMADLARRAAALGWSTLIVPAARARHDLSAASDLRQSLYAYYSLRNRFLYARRHASAPASRLAGWALRGGLAAIASLARGRPRRAHCQVLAVVDGLAGRFGPAGERVPR